MCFSKHNLGHFFFSQKACLRLLKTECFFRLTPKKLTAKFVSSLKMLRGTQHETRDGQFTKLPIRCQKGRFFRTHDNSGKFFIGRALTFSRRCVNRGKNGV